VKWLNCEKIQLQNLCNYGDSIVEKCLQYIDKYKVTEGSLWFDRTTSKVFRTNESYYTNIFSAFLAPRAEFLDDCTYGPKALASKYYVDSEIGFLSEDGVITDNHLLEKFKNSRILIIGAGPSALECQSLWREKLREYDFIWSCNHYFKPDFLKDIKFDLVTIGNEVDGCDKELLLRLEKDKTIVGIDTNISTKEPRFSNLLEKSKKSRFFFSTRYFGKIGSVPRMFVLANLLGVRHLSFVGADGVAPLSERDHVSPTVFEDKKIAKGPDNYDEYRMHYVMLWDYILNDLDREENMTFHNYGKSYKFNITGDIPEKRRREATDDTSHEIQKGK
jgi:hypothetical protein